MKGTHERLVHRHHAARVVKLATVVGRREEGHQLAFGEKLIPILHHLVSATDEIEIVPVEEFRHNIRPEGERHATIVLAPALHILVWVGPEEIAQEASVGHIGGTHNAANLLHRVQIGRQASVTAEDLLVDDGRNWKTVEAVGERLPQLDIVSSFTLIVEAVDSVDARALVIAAQEKEILRILDLVGQQEADGLEGLLASVHIVAEKEIVGLGREATVFEQPEKVRVLTVDVTANLEWRLQLEQNGLTQKDFARFETEGAHFGLGQLDRLPGTASADFQES